MPQTLLLGLMLSLTVSTIEQLPLASLEPHTLAHTSTAALHQS